MNEKDKQRFGQLLVTTAELFEKDLSAPVIKMYFIALERFSIEQVERALEKVVISCKFFPKPVEIIEFITGGPGKLEDIAQVQADIVVRAIRQIGAYQTVQFNDPVTTAVIQNCFGGWPMMCTELLEKNEQWFRKDFAKYYQAYSRQNIKSNGHLEGIIESENTMKGKLEFIPNPVQIGGGQTLKEIEYRN